MNIPVTSTLGFLGIVSLAIGLFLFLTGLGIFKVKQVTVMPGKKTWGAGLIFAILGIVLLMPELLKSNIPSPTDVAEIAQSSTIDVPDPLGSDVLEFASSIQFNIEPKGSLSKISGVWNSKWYYREENVWVSGTATILVTDDYWIHIIQEDVGGGQYVIKAKLVDNRLLGRYINVNKSSDTHPWVGILVDDNTIRGMWKHGAGEEWNFFRNP